MELSFLVLVNPEQRSYLLEVGWDGLFTYSSNRFIQLARFQGLFEGYFVFSCFEFLHKQIIRQGLTYKQFIWEVISGNTLNGVRQRREGRQECTVIQGTTVGPWNLILLENSGSQCMKQTSTSSCPRGGELGQLHPNTHQLLEDCWVGVKRHRFLGAPDLPQTRTEQAIAAEESPRQRSASPGSQSTGTL